MMTLFIGGPMHGQFRDLGDMPTIKIPIMQEPRMSFTEYDPFDFVPVSTNVVEYRRETVGDPETYLRKDIYVISTMDEDTAMYELKNLLLKRFINHAS